MRKMHSRAPRRRALWLAAGLLAALLTPAAAGAAPGGKAADLARFRTLETAWLAAMAGHDAVALDRLLAPEFVDTMWNGHLRDKAMVLAAARRPGGGHGPQHIADLAVQRYGDVAIVSGLDKAARATIRFTDVFVHRGGHWQAVRAQETRLRGGAGR